MKKAVAVASVLAQVACFLAIAVSLIDTGVFIKEMLDISADLIGSGDEDVLRARFSAYWDEKYISYRPYVGIGVLGGISSWIVLRYLNFRDEWFLTATKILGWLWIPLIPIGTAVGILILSGRPAELKKNEPAAT